MFHTYPYIGMLCTLLICSDYLFTVLFPRLYRENPVIFRGKEIRHVLWEDLHLLLKYIS